MNLVHMFRHPETEAKAYLMQSSVARSSVDRGRKEERGTKSDASSRRIRGVQLQAKDEPISQGLDFATKAATSSPCTHFSQGVVELLVESMTSEILVMAQEAVRLAFLTDGLGQLTADSRKRWTGDRIDSQSRADNQREGR